MHQNLRTDLQTTREANGLCERAAQELGVPPETITIELGHRRFRYIRPFTIRPAAPLGAGILDFGAPATGAMILHGYRDAGVQIREFLAYAPQSHFGAARHVLRMARLRTCLVGADASELMCLPAPFRVAAVVSVTDGARCGQQGSRERRRDQRAYSRGHAEGARFRSTVPRS
jgi:hypothetical protein